MARIPEKDLQNLINDVSSDRKHVRKPRQARKAQTGYLIAAIVIIIGGAGFSIVRSSTHTPSQEVADEPPSNVDSEGQPKPSTTFGTGTSDGGIASPVKRAPDYSRNLRPSYVMDKLPLPAAAFVSVDNLRAPSKENPLVLYVLLYSILDSYTEQIWIQKGLLRDEGPSISPYIRKVKIADVDSLRLLTDWHVESAAEIPKLVDTNK